MPDQRADENREHADRPLESSASPAARTPSASHDDDLSPAKTLRESATASGGQRLGDTTPVGPVVSFPDADAARREERPDAPARGGERAADANTGHDARADGTPGAP